MLLLRIFLFCLKFPGISENFLPNDKNPKLFGRHFSKDARTMIKEREIQTKKSINVRVSAFGQKLIFS
jgi:hypothetical protein